MSTAYIVEIEPGTQWLAPWKGDPGRTCILHSAKQFDSFTAARAALVRARWFSPFEDAEIFLVDVIIKKARARGLRVGKQAGRPTRVVR